MRPEVSNLFHQLADLSPEERSQYLNQHSIDPDVRREVEELLAFDTVSIDPPSAIVATARRLLSAESQPIRCGAFRLLRPLGRGGMGVVFLAEREIGESTQRAAVKLLHPGLIEIHRERFLQEREILARLTHPNIAHLLDVGHLDDGQPYLAMEFVEGKPIHQHCEGFTIQETIELFLKVCGAVEHLHQHSIVHRDLKPSNILVTGLEEPKLLDFGIAKFLHVDRDLTATHVRLLTPNFASPEQINGGEVGPASDIYSLAAVLHTILTGQPPQFEAVDSSIKGDLRIVLETALRPEPGDRYESVEEFAADLRALLGSFPIRARYGDRAYRVRKFARRYWRRVMLASAVAVAALSALGFYWYSSRASIPRALVPQRLTANTPELPVQTALIAPGGQSLAYSDPLGVHVREMASGATRLLPGSAGHLIQEWTPDGASLVTEYQDNAELRTMLLPVSGGLPVAAGDSLVWAASPDRKQRAAMSTDRQALLLAGHSASREIWRAGPDTRLRDFCWSPDSRSIALVAVAPEGSSIQQIEIASGKSSVLIPEERHISVASIVWPVPKRIIYTVTTRVGANNYNSNLWEISPQSGVSRKLTSWTDFPIQVGSLTTDGKRLFFIRSFAQRDAYVAAIAPGKTRLDTPRRLTLDLSDDYPTAWTPDSRAVILASDRTGTPRIFRQPLTAQLAEPMVTMAGTQILPRMGPGGRSLLFCDMVVRNQACRLHQLPFAGGEPRFVLDVADFSDFRCARAGVCVLTERHGREPGLTVFELNLEAGRGREIYRTDAAESNPDISPDGRWLASVVGTKIVVRSFATGGIAREISVPRTTRLSSLDYAADGNGFFAGDTTRIEGRELYVDLSGQATLLWRQAGSPIIWGVPSPDGRQLAMVMYTNDANVYMLEDF